MKAPPGSSCVRRSCCKASVHRNPGSVLQAEGRTCEDFQDEDSYSSSPDSSFSPFDGDFTTTSSSLFVDSLTTEGKGGRSHGPGASLPLMGIISGNRVVASYHI